MCIGSGFLSIPAGVIIRFIPIELICYDFRPKMKDTKTTNITTTVIMLQNWLEAFKKLRGGLYRLLMKRKIPRAFAAAIMQSTLVSASIAFPNRKVFCSGNCYIS